jgi:hypothetical protein
VRKRKNVPEVRGDVAPYRTQPFFGWSVSCAPLVCARSQRDSSGIGLFSNHKFRRGVQIEKSADGLRQAFQLFSNQASVVPPPCALACGFETAWLSFCPTKFGEWRSRTGSRRFTLKPVQRPAVVVPPRGVTSP